MKTRSGLRFRDYIIKRTVLLGSIPYALVFITASLLTIYLSSNTEIANQLFLAETQTAETEVNIAAARRMVETTAFYIDQAGLYPDTNRSGLMRYLSATLYRNPELSAFWITDAQSGIVSFSTPAIPAVVGHPLELEQEILDTAWAHPGRVIWSDVMHNPHYRGVYLSASVQLRGYILTAWFNPTALAGIIAHKQWDQRQFAFVCNSDGSLITHPKHELVRSGYSMLAIPAIQTSMKTGEPASSFFRLNGIDNEGYLYTVFRESETGWLIGVARARRDIFEYLYIFIITGVLAFFAGGALIILGAYKAAHQIDTAMGSLLHGTEAIARGDYRAELGKQLFLEFESLCQSIRTVQKAVQDREEKLQNLNINLENTVTERTRELQDSNRELTTAMEELSSAQERLIRTEKLSALGQLAAGIAHELNTPLGATISAQSLIEQFFMRDVRVLIGSLSKSEPQQLETFIDLYDRVLPRMRSTSTIIDRNERKKLQNRLEEKEIANAFRVTDLLINSGLSDLPESDPDFFRQPGSEQMLRALNSITVPLRMTILIQEAAQKASRVVQALQNYLRQDSAEVFRKTRIEEGIDSVLTLLHNKTKQGIHVTRDYSGLTVNAIAHQLSQVWMNLISNAARAMEYKGCIEIATKKSGDKAVIMVYDDGPEIPEEYQEKIFEPFFTTKIGEGMGLGLDICQKIIRAHNGTISVESRPGRTVFTVELPLAKED